MLLRRREQVGELRLRVASQPVEHFVLLIGQHALELARRLLLGRVSRGVAALEQRLIVGCGRRGDNPVVDLVRGLDGKVIDLDDRLLLRLPVDRARRGWLVGQYFMGARHLFGPGGPDAGEQVVDIDIGGLGLIVVVEHFDHLDDLHYVDDLHDVDDLHHVDHLDVQHCNLVGIDHHDDVRFRVGLLDHPHFFEVRGRLDRHHLALGQLLVEVLELGFVLDERQACVTRRLDLGFELFGRSLRLRFDASRGGVGHLLRRLQRTFQFVRRFVERAPHDVVGLEQTLATSLQALELDACGLALAREILEHALAHEQRFIDHLAALRSRRLEHLIGLGLRVRVDPLDVGLGFLGRGLAGGKQFDDGRLGLRLRRGPLSLRGRADRGGGLFRFLRAASENGLGLALHPRGLVLRFAQQPGHALLTLGSDLRGGFAGREEHSDGFFPE